MQLGPLVVVAMMSDLYIALEWLVNQKESEVDEKNELRLRLRLVGRWAAPSNSIVTFRGKSTALPGPLV
jgi:hypothetical protein